MEITCAMKSTCDGIKSLIKKAYLLLLVKYAPLSGDEFCTWISLKPGELFLPITDMRQH